MVPVVDKSAAVVAVVGGGRVIDHVGMDAIVDHPQGSVVAVVVVVVPGAAVAAVDAAGVRLRQQRGGESTHRTACLNQTIEPENGPEATRKTRTTTTMTTKSDPSLEGGLDRKPPHRQTSFRHAQADPEGKGNRFRKR